jgi:5-methylcytosine-specific restriction endonuclease McrA
VVKWIKTAREVYNGRISNVKGHWLIMDDFRKELKRFYNSREWQTARAVYIRNRKEIDGGLCENCKNQKGTEAKHINPVNSTNISDRSVTLDSGNLKYLCRECAYRITAARNEKYAPRLEVRNGMYTDADGNAQRQKIRIVWGAPFAGKATYVQEHMECGDFVIDLSRMMKIFSEHSQESFPQNLLDPVLKTLEFVQDLAASGELPAKTVWLITGGTRKSDRQKLMKKFPTAEWIFIDKSKDYCIDRIERTKRVTSKHKMIDRMNWWFDRYEPD